MGQEATDRASAGDRGRRSSSYDTFAQNADEARRGLTLREAFIRLLVLLWQDNEPEEVEAMWRTLARRPGPFTSDALVVLDDVIADPPADLVELRRTHGWLPQREPATAGDPGDSSHSDALEWLIEMRTRLQAIHDAEHPPPSRR